MRTRTLVTAAVVATGLVTAAVLAGQQAASAGTAHTLVAHETFTKTFPQDAATKGVPVGDRLSYATVVKDLKGVKLGIGVGECVHLTGTSDTAGLFNCLQTYRLGGGDFTTAGIFDFGAKINKWVIMGGTGRYRGATGEYDFTTLSPDTFADTFHFDS